MIEVRNLTKELANGKRILNDISFTARRGEFIGILGPSGAGKTSLIRCLNGLTSPSKGQVIIKTDSRVRDIAACNRKELRRLRSKIGIIFQGLNLVKRSTTLENVMMGRLGTIHPLRSLLYGFTDREAKEALQALAKVKIADLAKRKVMSLSGGEMQRVAIARAIFQRPVILLADEPIANLDPLNAEKIMQLLLPFSRDMPVIGVFHQPQIAQKYCSRILAIRAGEVVYSGPPNLTTNQLAGIYGEEYDELNREK